MLRSAQSRSLRNALTHEEFVIFLCAKSNAFSMSSSYGRLYVALNPISKVCQFCCFYTMFKLTNQLGSNLLFFKNIYLFMRRMDHNPPFKFTV